MGVGEVVWAGGCFGFSVFDCICDVCFCYCDLCCGEVSDVSCDFSVVWVSFACYGVCVLFDELVSFLFVCSDWFIVEVDGSVGFCLCFVFVL